MHDQQDIFDPLSLILSLYYLSDFQSHNRSIILDTDVMHMT